MNINMKLQVIQGKRYEVDGNKGAALFGIEKTDGSNPDLIGMDIMKLNCDYELVDQLREFLPCECELVCKPIQGAGQKMSFRVLSVKPVPKPGNQKAA